MTDARITRPEGYECAPNGAVAVRFPMGEVVSGAVAKWAIADGAAEALHDPRTAVQAMQEVPETKAKRGRPRK